MSQNPQFPSQYPPIPQQGGPQQPAYPQGNLVQMPPPPAQLPQFYMPQNPAEAQRQFQASVGSKGGRVNGLEVRYADIPGPRGEKDWKDVPAGYQGSQRVYMLPSWRPEGLPLFVLSEWHYWKSMRYPRGMSVGCPGRDTCEICQAAIMAEGHPDPNVVKRAKDFGRNRRKWLYQVVLLDFPQLHIYEDGKFRPAILSCSYSLQQAFLTVCNLKHRSITDCVHPQLGNPWIIAKKKTGGSAMDVEYSAVDLPPEPLPQQFWPALSNLWDLTQLLRVSTESERHMAALDMGLITGGMSVQVPQQYQPQQYQQPAPQPFNSMPVPQQMPNTIQPAAPPLPYQTAPGMGMPVYPQPQAQPQTPWMPQPPAQPTYGYQPPPSEEQQLQFPPPEYGAFAQPPQPPPMQQPYSYQQQAPVPQAPQPPMPMPLPAAPSAPPPVSYQPQQAMPAPQMPQAPQQAPGAIPMPPPPPIPAQAPQVANPQELQQLQARLAGK
jgi:hypothetical protein